MLLNKKRQGGQAIVELLLISITMLFTILGVLQMALALNAYTLVRYAAYNATRAGIVHGGNKDFMLEAARISLLATFPSHGRADHIKGLEENYLSAVATDTQTNMTANNLPITDVQILNKDKIPCNKVVTFDDPAEAEDSLLTVRVTHQYQLVIPLVNRMLYYVYQQVENLGAYQGETPDQIAAITDQKRRTGEYLDIEYRIPLSATYTMRMQSDYVKLCN